MLFGFKTIALFQIPVILVEEDGKALKHAWIQDSTRTRLASNRQIVKRLTAVILPLLHRRKQLQLDLRKNDEISTVNSLILVHDLNDYTAMNAELMLTNRTKSFVTS